MAGSVSGPFWMAASKRVYCQEGVHYDEKVGAWFNLVTRKEQVEPSEDSREAGSVSRAESAQSGYSSFNSCQDSVDEKKVGL